MNSQVERTQYTHHSQSLYNYKLNVRGRWLTAVTWPGEFFDFDWGFLLCSQAVKKTKGEWIQHIFLNRDNANTQANQKSSFVKPETFCLQNNKNCWVTSGMITFNGNPSLTKILKNKNHSLLGFWTGPAAPSALPAPQWYLCQYALSLPQSAGCVQYFGWHCSETQYPGGAGLSGIECLSAQV